MNARFFAFVSKRLLLGCVAFAAEVSVSSRAAINSGSDGSDGIFKPTADTVIDMADHPDGIYQYTSVEIRLGVTVSFIRNQKNTPVTWLVQGECIIKGDINLSAHAAQAQHGGAGGPGGWDGGSGGSNPSPGQGPGGGGAGPEGGGGSFGTRGGALNPATCPTCGEAGITYGNSFLLPLVGGSGGGGGGGEAGGGGGGGAILIACSGTLQLDGTIFAIGGAPGRIDPQTGPNGAGGSGGGIRLVTPHFTGKGSLNAGGGLVNYGGNGGAGRIRIDTFESTFGGTYDSPFTQGFQPIIIPTEGGTSQLTIASVGGINLKDNPSGLLLPPDVIIPGDEQNPLSVVVRCSQIPLNTIIKVTVRSATGPMVSETGLNTVGTVASSSATVMLNIPRGGGIIFASASIKH
jgi:hypothetical protein